MAEAKTSEGLWPDDETSGDWQPVCKFFKRSKGTCRFGAACTFRHQMAGEPPVEPRADWDFMANSDCGGRAQDSDVSVKLCTAWINTGRCPRMSACKFRHGTCGVEIGKARARWIAERRQRRALLPSTPGDDIPSHDKLGYRARAAVMARWMTETFRKEDLEKGVLDVAGGRGDLSFELSMTHSLNCTVVDPRPVRLNKCQVPCRLAILCPLSDRCYTASRALAHVAKTSDRGKLTSTSHVDE